MFRNRSALSLCIAAMACAAPIAAAQVFPGVVYFRGFETALGSNPPLPYGNSMIGGLDTAGEILVSGGGGGGNTVSGYWFADSNQKFKVAQGGDPAVGLVSPTRYQNFEGGGPHVNGRFAFGAHTDNPAAGGQSSSGIWVFDKRTGTSVLAFTEGQTLANGGGTIGFHNSLGNPILPGVARLDNAGSLYKDVYIDGSYVTAKWSNGVATRFMGNGQSAVWIDSSSTVTGVGLQYVSTDGAVYFTASHSGSGGTGTSLVKYENGSFASIYREGQAVTGLAATITAPLSIITFADSGNFVCKTVLQGTVTNNNNDAIYAVTPAGARLIAREGSSAVGTGALRNTFQNISISFAGDVAFMDAYIGGPGGGSGVFWNVGSGPTTLVAYTGMLMPGLSPGGFLRIMDGCLQSSNGGTGLLFWGETTESNTAGVGLWLSLPGQAPMLIHKNNDPIMLQNLGLTNFTINRVTGFNADNTILVEGFFANGEEGIVTMTIPSPGSLAALSSAAILVLQRRRRR